MAWITPSLTKNKMSGIRLYEYNPTAPSKAMKKIHPTQKPIPLYRWIFNKYTKKGDKVLDTHMGSQSSRVAAYEMGVNYWGCEIDPGYFEDGCEYFKQKTAQLQLFKY
jgi:site-specific DNA-methyltransferase (adenine-specific)